jgi:hypothetical protein
MGVPAPSLGKLTGRKKPEAVSALLAFADLHGVDSERGVTVNAVLIDGRIHDPVARLWAQAERIRAYLADRRSNNDVAMAIRELRRFFATPKQGLWFDQLAVDDRFVLEPARATSLYHIIGVAAELADASKAGPPAAADPRKPAPRLIYLVTEDWYFISHRLPMARAARTPASRCTWQRGSIAMGRRSRPKDFICIRSRGAAAASILATSFGWRARSGRSIAASGPILPITSPCRRPSSDRSPPSACRSLVSTP